MYNMASDVSRVHFTTWGIDAAAVAIIRLACALTGHVVCFAVVVGDDRGCDASGRRCFLGYSCRSMGYSFNVDNETKTVAVET